MTTLFGEHPDLGYYNGIDIPKNTLNEWYFAFSSFFYDIVIEKSLSGRDIDWVAAKTPPQNNELHMAFVCTEDGYR